MTMSLRQPTPLAELLNYIKSPLADLTKKDYLTLVVNSAFILPIVAGDDHTPPVQGPTEIVEPEPPPDLSGISETDFAVVMCLLNDVFNSFNIPIKQKDIDQRKFCLLTKAQINSGTNTSITNNLSIL